jgi:dipeptidyl-peptidase-4
MKKIETILLFLIITVTMQAQPQPLKTISAPYKWSNNENVVLVKTSGFKKNYNTLNIKTLTMSEYKPDVKNELQVTLRDGDIYVVLSPKEMRRLTNTSEQELNPALSPDNAKVAFTRNNDLYSIDIASGKETRLTFEGSSLILNGRASWVYYEEIFGRATNYSAFWWSPDSRTILYYRFDDTEVPLYPIMNYDGQHGTVTETRYPKAGDTNPSVRIGFVSCDGGETIWAQSDPQADQYFGTPFWKPDGSGCLIQWMNRGQDTLFVYDVAPADGKMTRIYEENQKTWIDWIDEVVFGSQGFYMVRDRDMWQNIWYQSFDGKMLAKVSEGKHWGTKILDVNEKGAEIWFTSRGSESVRNDLFRTNWKRGFEKPVVVKMSEGAYNYRSVLLSPDKKRYVALISNLNTPDKLVLVNTGKKGTEVEEIENSKDTEYDFSQLPIPELMYITTKDGFRLPGTITLPFGFREDKKYPVIFNIYGGPDHSNVMDIWKTPSQNAVYWAQAGVIQVNVDNRASGHCGKEGENFVFRNLGRYEISDFIAWADYLRSLPYIDGSKIGITGFSFGGTMTALALTEGAEYFRFGIAGGGVYDWRLYDSHYTERYMDTPSENPDGYRESAVINKAAKYLPEKGALLKLTHGTGDDNVHLQNTMQFINALIYENKHFELMLYPGGMHGYRAKQAIHSANEDIAFWTKVFGLVPEK